MTEFITDFIDAMSAKGCAPARASDIKPGVKNKLIKGEDDGKSSKSLYYTLDVDGDRASGRWHSCKSGNAGTWSSRSNRKWTKEEKEEWKAKIKAEEKAHKEEVRAQQKEIAGLAKKLWKKARVNEKHPYLVNKQIPVSNTRCVDDMLLVPMKDEKGEIWNLQTILPDGSKYNSFKLADDTWAKGGRKKGLYHSITKRDPDLSTLYICEGFATGGSIAMATGHPVVVAFDTGNLKDVAKKIKIKYGQADLIVAADNDQWTIKTPRPSKLEKVKTKNVQGDDERWAQWREMGWLFNPGLEKGREAAKEVGAELVYPAPPANSKDKPTDFNDMHVVMGVDATWKVLCPESNFPEHPPEYFEVVPDHVLEEDCEKYGILEVFNPKPRDNESAVGPVLNDEYSGVDKKTGEPKWKELLLYKSRSNEIEPASGHNTKILIERMFPGLFRHNEFSDEIWVCKKPLWDNKKKFIVRPICDNDITNMSGHLETCGLNYNPKRTKEAIEVVAEKHSLHPVREYFDKLEWDGVPRLETWLEEYCGAMEQDKEYLKTVGTLWMVAAARRIYEPGAKFDHMLVLEGKQAIGKSTALRVLATFGDDHEVSYFTEMSMQHIGKPDALQMSQGKVIIEFAELDGIKSAADTKLKGWISAQVDEIVKKYQIYVTKYPRQFVLAGTTNDTDYLKDTTGNRRYWPVKCQWVNTRELKKVKEQLWAEAIHLHKQGHKIYIADTDPVYHLAYKEQTKRLDSDPWEEIIAPLVKDKRYVSSTDILLNKGMTMRDIRPIEQARVNSIMTKLGWDQRQDKKITGHRRRVWFNPKYENDSGSMFRKPEEEVEVEY